MAMAPGLMEPYERESMNHVVRKRLLLATLIAPIVALARAEAIG